MNFLGVDPGADGAWCLLLGDKPLAWDQPMHKLGKSSGAKRRVDIGGTLELAERLAFVGITFAVQEEVAGWGMGGASAFTFGATATVAEAAIFHAAIPYQLEPPTKWKKHFGLWGKGKDESIALASKLLPQGRHLWTPQRGAVTQAQAEGRSEAALLAVYARFLAARAGLTPTISPV